MHMYDIAVIYIHLQIVNKYNIFHTLVQRIISLVATSSHY